MAAASEAQSDIVCASLVAIGAVVLFDPIATVTEIPVGKRAPGLFRNAAWRWGTPPNDCLVFKNSTEDPEAAKRAGMLAIDIQNICGTKGD